MLLTSLLTKLPPLPKPLKMLLTSLLTKLPSLLKPPKMLLTKLPQLPKPLKLPKLTHLNLMLPQELMPATTPLDSAAS